MNETLVGRIEQLTTTPTPSSSLRSAVDALVSGPRKEKLMEVWIVGQAKDLDTGVGDFVHDWEFQGVFDDKGKATSACIDENYFMFPACMNGALPHGTVENVAITWPAR